MGNWIQINGKDSLRLSNRSFDLFYRTLDGLVQNQNINDNLVIKFIEKMDQDAYGGGMILLDINNYFKNAPTSLLILINLFKVANQEIIEKYNMNGWSEILNPFIQELDDYYSKILSKNK